MWTLIKQFFCRADPEVKRLIECMKEQESNGWVFHISPRGALSKTYHAEKDKRLLK